MKNKKIIQIQSIGNRYFDVMWELTDWCNYRCPYCCQGNKSNIKYVSEESLIDKAKKLNIILEKQDKKDITMSLMGGEICYYNIDKILDEIKCNIKKLIIITNFSNNLDYYKKLYDYCNSRGTWLHLMCSYHEVGENFIIKFLDLIKWNLERNYPMPIISFVLDDDFDFSLIEKFPELPRALLHFNLKQVSSSSDYFVKLNDDIKEKWNNLLIDKHKWSNNVLIKDYLRKKRDGELPWHFKEYGYELMYEDGEKEHIGNMKAILGLDTSLLFNINKYCNSLLKCIFITPNGEIHRCSTNGIYLGNLDNFNLDLTNIELFRCNADPCALCHSVNIYDSKERFIENEK